MIALGISGGFGGGYQDACAMIYVNGELKVAIEEERLNRIKFSAGTIPLKSIQYCLDALSISMKEVDVIGFHGSTWGAHITAQLEAFFIHHWNYCPAIEILHHHDAHAASSFYHSGFDESLVFTIDNSGDGVSFQVIHARKDNGFQLLNRTQRPHSFGTFYGTMTQLAGFQRDADEYKLMGLAPYGNPNAFPLEFFLSSDGNGSIKLNPECVRFFEEGKPFPNKQIPLYSDFLKNRITSLSANEISQNQALRADIAASTQAHLEKTAKATLQYWINKTGIKKICLAGGVSLNCAMNQKILEMPELEDLFVPPFAGDQGIASGAAILASVKRGFYPKEPLMKANWGKTYDVSYIEKRLIQCGIAFEKAEDICEEAAKYLADGKVIAWFQGGSEIGPRALGQRSILAHPGIKGMKAIINEKIKFRESFRPFCPSVCEEDFEKYFTSSKKHFPFMNITVNATEFAIKHVPESVHFDNTARVQTVSSIHQPLFHKLLKAFEKHSGHPVLINTSFNVRNHPIVEDVTDALECFFSSGLDVLIIHNFIIEKLIIEKN